MRQGDFTNLCPHRLHIRNRLADGCLNLLIHSVNKIFLWESDLQPLDICTECLCIVRDIGAARRRVHRIMPCNYVHEMGCIRDIARERSDLIE